MSASELKPGTPVLLVGGPLAGNVTTVVSGPHDCEMWMASFHVREVHYRIDLPPPPGFAYRAALPHWLLPLSPDAIEDAEELRRELGKVGENV